MNQSPPTLPTDAIEVARIVDAWGVRGDIKLQPFSDTADGLLRVDEWFLKSPKGDIKSVTVKKAKWHSDTVVASLMGYEDRTAVEAFKAWTVWVRKTALPKTAQGEYYWLDLIGCTVLAADGKPLGQVKTVSDNGVHSVLELDCEGYAPVLIPFVDAYVGEVDLTKKTIATQWQHDWLEPL